MEDEKGAWYRPYATFEKVNLNNCPNVESISYGSYFGGDSPVYKTKNGWQLYLGVQLKYPQIIKLTDKKIKLTVHLQ